MKKSSTITILAIGLVVGGLVLLSHRSNPQAPSNIVPSGHGAAAPPARDLNTQTASSGHGGSATQAAPNFSLPNVDGSGNVSLADFKGKKPVLLSFWATWCPNCQRNMPKLSKLSEKYGDQVEVIGINLKESSSKVQKFLDDRNITFTNLLDPGQAAQQYGIRYTNTHYLIDKDGNLLATVPGDINESHFKTLASSS